MHAVEELYGTRYQSGSFFLTNVGSGFHYLRSFCSCICQQQIELTCRAGSTAGSTTRDAKGSSTAAGTVISISILASMAREVEVRGTTAVCMM